MYGGKRLRCLFDLREELLKLIYTADEHHVARGRGCELIEE